MSWFAGGPPQRKESHLPPRPQGGPRCTSPSTDGPRCPLHLFCLVRLARVLIACYAGSFRLGHPPHPPWSVEKASWVTIPGSFSIACWLQSPCISPRLPRACPRPQGYELQESMRALLLVLIERFGCWLPTTCHVADAQPAVVTASD
jgi:hypothetical protein